MPNDNVAQLVAESHIIQLIYGGRTGVLVDHLGNKFIQVEVEGVGELSVYQDMLDFLELAWPMRKEIIPCLIGPPGIGKTSVVMDFAETLGKRDGKKHKVVKLILSRCVPSETVGMTMPNNAERTMDIYNSRLLGSLEDGDLLFLDEFYEATPFVQSVMLTVLESREMADGTPLPDIMIIGASNPVSSPNSIKLSVRDRFITREFKIDGAATVKFIKEKYGMNVDFAAGHISNKGRMWNTLTPRTLTKLVEWMTTAENETEAKRIGDVIDNAFESLIGTKLLNAWVKANRPPVAPPEEQVRQKVVELYENGVISSYDTATLEDPIATFRNTNMVELMNILQSLPNWETVKSALEQTAVEEDDDDDMKSNVPF